MVMERIYEVRVRPLKLWHEDEHRGSIEYRVWDQSPDAPDMIRHELYGDGYSIVKDADNHFEAMCQIRGELEKDGALLECYGASLNVFPSGMSTSMGDGSKAYKLVMGQPAKLTDLVTLWDVGTDVVPTTLDQQAEFFRQWTQSL